MPFNIACGTCRNCTAGCTCACLRANPSGRPTAGYRYPMMGPYWGGQARYLRVPWADFNLLKLPADTEHENDFTMLSDIFPTGYHGTELAGVAPGDTVAIFGAGPVGPMAAHSAALRGAAQVFRCYVCGGRGRLGRSRGAELDLDAARFECVQRLRPGPARPVVALGALGGPVLGGVQVPKPSWKRVAYSGGRRQAATTPETSARACLVDQAR